ncbi:aromatic-ring-hydroxylating dioxygenase subunit beta [Methylocystis iwaonis]|uniref:aromatic-ring-hydroxylating dioxygenase subunit beta n=1 Tax=Methylocystis iwaonis TaxID=2885079 RepID=UPI002E7B542E|nr:aromatic-ring-hydroxylating dioxygenase subunit beta [Methylocystis iwaonis]
MGELCGAAVMTATSVVSYIGAVPIVSDIVSRITSFLALEADLLDDWRLEDWFELFEPGGRYIVAPLQRHAESAPEQALCLILDDYDRLRARVRHFAGASTWMEQPRSRTRRLMSNLRLLAPPTEEIVVRVNFVVYQFRNHESWEFIGSARYRLVTHEAEFRIRERFVHLDHESISKQRRISIII